MFCSPTLPSSLSLSASTTTALTRANNIHYKAVVFTWRLEGKATMYFVVPYLCRMIN